MKKLYKAIIAGVVFAFLGLIFTSAESGGVWFLLGILAFYMEWRFEKDDDKYERQREEPSQPIITRKK